MILSREQMEQMPSLVMEETIQYRVREEMMFYMEIPEMIL